MHHARLAPWSQQELVERLTMIVVAIAARNDDHTVAPLDVALELLSGELEAFVLFGRTGHLDSPRPDGKLAVAILQRKSADPRIDEKIREVAQKWAALNSAKDR